MRVYPAYGRKIAQLLARGMKPSAIGVLFSERWGYFEAAPRMCVKPSEWAYLRWEFGFLRNQHVVVIQGDEAEPALFGQLLIEIMEAQPRLIWTASIFDGWLQREPDGYTFGTQVREWWSKTPGYDAAAAQRVFDAYRTYMQGQQREVEQESKRMARAEEEGGDLYQAMHFRNPELAIAERLFSDPFAVPDDVAA